VDWTSFVDYTGIVGPGGSDEWITIYDLNTLHAGSSREAECPMTYLLYSRNPIYGWSWTLNTKSYLKIENGLLQINRSVKIDRNLGITS